MNRRVAWLAVAGLLLLRMLPVAAAPVTGVKPPTADDIAKAQKAVEENEKLKAGGAIIEPIKDEAVGNTLPEYAFIAVWFRQFPIARVLPEGFSASNIFAVDRDGKTTLLKDTKELEKFFRTHLRPTKGEEGLKDTARAYVRLAQQFHNDGFFKFKLMDDATKVGGEEGARTATATVVAMQGGSGTLSGTLTFDADGKLKEVSEDAKLRRGPRPICQATKLLDADPIVRRMAEQDLLCMGTAAKGYLDEQRAKASPELRRAIDRVWQRILAAQDRGE
jgi:hypothetical protein